MENIEVTRGERIRVYPVKLQGRVRPESAFEDRSKAEARAEYLNSEWPALFLNSRTSIKWVVGKPFTVYLEG